MKAEKKYKMKKLDEIANKLDSIEKKLNQLGEKNREQLTKIIKGEFSKDIQEELSEIKSTLTQNSENQKNVENNIKELIRKND